MQEYSRDRHKNCQMIILYTNQNKISINIDKKRKLYDILFTFRIFFVQFLCFPPECRKAYMIWYCSVTKQWLLPASPSIHVVITMSSGHEPFGKCSPKTPKIMSGLLALNLYVWSSSLITVQKPKMLGMIFRRRHAYFTAAYEFLFLSSSQRTFSK